MKHGLTLSADIRETNVFDIVWGYHTPPQMDPPESNFFNGLTLGASVFDISRYLADKYFDIVWRYPRRPPQNQFFERLNLGCHFFDISRYLREKYFDIVRTA